MEPADGSGAVTSTTHDGSPGSYTLRELIRDVPLSTDEETGKRAHVTCVDAWNGNLYIGTSSGQVLHYVSIPPDPSDESGQPSYIFATIIEPEGARQPQAADAGVKQILLLPSAGKACIVCNSTLTFYTLPELSPAFDGRIRQAGCLWVGGLDNNQGNGDYASEDTVIVICLRQRLRVIKIAEEATKIRDIQLGSVSSLQRRGDLACVADGYSYSLLDIVNQRKNELFPISSSSAPRDVPVQPLGPTRQASRSFSSHSPARPSRSHSRNISLGGQLQADDRLRPEGASPWPARRSSRLHNESPAPLSSREESPAKVEQPAETQIAIETEPPKSKEEEVKSLPPNIATPTPKEFLLTTGTRLSDPGVGIFVNFEGDVVRGTIEFSSYPLSLVLDTAGQSANMPKPDDETPEGYVLGLVQKTIANSLQRCIEVQRWDTDPSEAHRTKEWITLGPISDEDQDNVSYSAGLRIATTSADLVVNSVSSSLRLRRLRLRDQDGDGVETRRNAEEDKLAGRFSQVQANVLLFADDRISWVTQTPLIARLDLQLNAAVQTTSERGLTIDVPLVQRVINSIRGQEPRDELEFLTLTYVRQKAAVLLFGNLVLQTTNGVIAYEHDKRRAEDTLTSGELDPRIVLAMVPPFDQEIAEGSSGMWMAQGLRDTVQRLRDSFDSDKIIRDVKGPYGDNLLQLIKRYLMTWRKKKGFGSVADEAYVFRTVDAALLHALLMLDQDTPRGPATAGSVRAELNEVVDNGVDCFDRAVELFEQYHRLFMLSRLYQNRRQAPQVLVTWRRILEGEKDSGGEFIDGEQTLRRYLSRIRDPALVQDYGAWLANRNPKLGVQIFADDNSKVKFQAPEAVAILKEKAPFAVKDFLEHLVFGKNHVQYVNDLIAFYLDTVLDELSTSQESRDTLRQSYETYRALHPPKPTYREFITDNAIDADWWHNRLRLLQLIGGSHGAASKYDIHTLGERLATYSNELVPEMIILNGREGKHQEALRLLTHGLGDYDTAIRYCLLGGSSIFHPSSGLEPEQALPSHQEQAHLFEHLLHEFFKIEDLSERLERTAELLERFGAWYDIAKVLDMIPDFWSVELVSGFLVRAFRRLVREKNETIVMKALCSAQNLRASVVFAEKNESFGARVVREEDDMEVSR